MPNGCKTHMAWPMNVHPLQCMANIHTYMKGKELGREEMEGNTTIFRDIKMANFVAPGHLKIKDEEKLDLRPKKGVLNIKAKNFKIGGNKGGSGIAGGKAPKVLIKNKTPLQPEASSMEGNFPKGFDIEERLLLHGHSKCMGENQRIHIALWKTETALRLHNVLPKEEGMLNIKSKNFKIGGNKGGSGIAGGKAPKVLIKNKTPLQPEGLSMEEIFPEDFDVDEQHHDHSKCMSKIERIHIAQLKVETAWQLHNVLPKEESGLARLKRLMREMKDKDTCKCELDDYSGPYRLFISSPSSSDSTPSPSPQDSETCESVLKEGIGAQMDPIIQ